MEKNLQPVARTLSEALRDAEYCMAIQTFKSDTKLTLEFIGGALMGFLIVGVISLACYGLYKML